MSAAEQVTEPTWDYWQAALAGTAGATSEGYPEQGFWRKPNQKGGFDAVAIWWQDGQWWARLGADRYEDAIQIWTWCAKHPIAHEEYEKVLAGGTWSNLDPVVAEQIAEGQAGKKAQARREAAAGNNSSEADPAEILKDQIEAALKGVDAYGKIESDEQAGAAISLRNRLNELKNEADKLREKMVRPHLDAQQAINGKWMPLVKGAEAGGKKLVKLCEVWESAKLAERRKAEAEALARARAREEDERRLQDAQAAAMADGRELPPHDPETGELIEFPPDELPPAPAKTQVRGSYGKAAAITVKKAVTAIDDIDALFAFMRERTEVHDCLFKLAQRAVDAGHEVPGVTVEEKAKMK